MLETYPSGKNAAWTIMNAKIAEAWTTERMISALLCIMVGH
jgi:hypothetical protein